MAVVINGTTGITTPADSVSGNLTFTGTGNRITGDFSNATVANRVLLQSSTTNGATTFGVIPNGTSTISQIALETDSAATNGSVAQFSVTGGTDVRIQSNLRGTGTYLPMTFFTGGSERMRIDTSGNVGIGTNAPAAANKLQVLSTVADQGFAVGGATKQLRLSYDNTGNYGKLNAADFGTAQTSLKYEALEHIFGTGIYSAPERARIDSSGNLLVACTSLPSASASSGAGMGYSGAGGNLLMSNTAGTEGIAINYTTYTSGTVYPIVFRANGNTKGFINYNGTSVAYVNSSDRRLKTNIVDAPSALPLLKSVKVRQFNWIESNELEQFGFIAQELNTVIPNATSVGKDNDDGSIDMPWGVDPSKMVGLCIKAIQEQQSIIESLKARLDAANL